MDIVEILRQKGMIEEAPTTITQEEAERLHREYLEMVGSRKLGLSETVLEQRGPK